jgi:hypothetical protein
MKRVMLVVLLALGGLAPLVSGCNLAEWEPVSVSLSIAGHSADADGVYHLEPDTAYQPSWDARLGNGRQLERDFDDFTWTTSNSSVIRIDDLGDRFVTGTAGSATITGVMTNSGLSDTIRVQVD